MCVYFSVPTTNINCKKLYKAVNNLSEMLQLSQFWDCQRWLKSRCKPYSADQLQCCSYEEWLNYIYPDFEEPNTEKVSHSATVFLKKPWKSVNCILLLYTVTFDLQPANVVYIL